MSYKYILFDLDGTLTDPKEGITRSVAYALSSLGIEVPNPDDLCKFIGPPLRESFIKYYNLSESDADTALLKYRERFSSVGIFENIVYEGIDGLLRRLKSLGKTLAVATSKPHPFAKRILEHFELSRYFDFVAGPEFDGTRGTKSEVIAYALDECGIADRASAVMVGDRVYDIVGAKSAGIYSIGVLYGYGSRAELEEAGADYIVKTVDELSEFLCK